MVRLKAQFESRALISSRDAADRKDTKSSGLDFLASTVVWVEVEQSYRSTGDLDRLARFILRIFERESYCVAYRDGWLDELHLVVSDPVAATIGHRLYRKLSELVGETATRQLFASRLRVLTL